MNEATGGLADMPVVLHNESMDIEENEPELVNVNLTETGIIAKKNRKQRSDDNKDNNYDNAIDNKDQVYKTIGNSKGSKKDSNETTYAQDGYLTGPIPLLEYPDDSDSVSSDDEGKLYIAEDPESDVDDDIPVLRISEIENNSLTEEGCQSVTPDDDDDNNPVKNSSTMTGEYPKYFTSKVIVVNNEHIKVATCQICTNTTDIRMKDSNTSGLKWHLQKQHPDIYDKINPSTKNSDQTQRSLTQYLSSQTQVQTLDPVELDMWTVEFIAKKYLPLNFFSDDCSQSFFKFLNTNGNPKSTRKEHQ
ncbi:hypothetical protein HCN44_007737 [Aphidius gifuensis]|uniref:BED-type domain-containing protein n=1 Tax=Aphidius gifuensis TaxID=684658 RepID=A0A835CME3_APHGI|nr:hypothetical protein HCN44_007737 [Aphidius gifuensis]